MRLGKRIVGTGVADAQTGEPIGYKRAALRRLVYCVEAIPLYLAWLWMFTNPDRQTWHDKAARSVVVSARPQA